MKLHGIKISGPNVETIIIPRGDEEPIVLKVRAVLDMKPFEKACPEPKAPMKIVKGGQKIPNLEDEIYKSEVLAHGKKRLAFMVLTGLEATEGLEWERAKIGDSSTWLLFEDELQESGFSQIEINRIIQGVMAANCLNDDKIEEARNRFQRMTQEEVGK